jgi:hypothetical protein
MASWICFHFPAATNQNVNFMTQYNSFKIVGRYAATCYNIERPKHRRM